MSSTLDERCMVDFGPSHAHGLPLGLRPGVVSSWALLLALPIVITGLVGASPGTVVKIGLAGFLLGGLAHLVGADRHIGAHVPWVAWVALGRHRWLAPPRATEVRQWHRQ